MLKKIFYLLISSCLFISVSVEALEIKVSELSKSCKNILEKNIIYYELCKNWTLNDDEVFDIIKQKEQVDIFNPIRDLSPSDMLIYYSGKVAINKINYDITIYATSWFSLYNNSTDKIKYYFCQEKKCSNYFIGNYISESILSKADDENIYEFEEQLLAKMNNYKDKVIGILSKYKIDKKWIKTYNISGYKLIISENNCIIKNLNDKTTNYCFVFSDDKLYVYTQLKSGNGYTKINGDRFADGDFILKVDRPNTD